MKKISLMLVAVMLLVSTSSFANDGIENNPSKELKSKVKKLLDGYYEMSSNDRFEAIVIFTVNKENEIVVLSVDSEDRNFSEFVKHKLNYKALRIDGVIEGRRYTIPITIQV